MRWTTKVLVPGMAAVVWVSALAQEPTFHLGRTPTAEEIRAWDISITPDGKELPAGSGTAKQGAPIYAQKCAYCHGPTGEKGQGGPPLAGGKKTLANFVPFATPIWDYINRAMPFDKPGTLRSDEVYALTAFVLYKNGIIGESDVLDSQSLPKIQMPNRYGLVPPWPFPEYDHRQKRPFGWFFP